MHGVSMCMCAGPSMHVHVLAMAILAMAVLAMAILTMATCGSEAGLNVAGSLRKSQFIDVSSTW